MTAYNASKMATGVQPKYLPSAAGVHALSTIDLTTALALNDTINFLSIAAQADNPNGYGPSIIGMLLDSDQLDSNASPTLKLDVGDGTTAARFYNQTTIVQGGGVAMPNVAGTIGYQPFASSFGTYTTQSNLTYNVIGTCAAAPATWKNGNLRLLVSYSYDA